MISRRVVIGCLGLFFIGFMILSGNQATPDCHSLQPVSSSVPSKLDGEQACNQCRIQQGFQSPLVDTSLALRLKKQWSLLPSGILPLLVAPGNAAMMASSWSKIIEPGCSAWVNSKCKLSRIPNSPYSMEDHMTLYSMIRFFKPKVVLEVGSGASSFTVGCALDELFSMASTARSQHICIEPFRSRFINVSTKPRIVEKLVQEVDLAELDALSSGDLLFLDNSHVSQPYGDVLFEFLFMLPRLKAGVVIHIHDIFLPLDYHDSWRIDWRLPYTEQYLLALFLHRNDDFEIIWSASHWAIGYEKQFAKWNLSAGARVAGGFWLRKSK